MREIVDDLTAEFSTLTDSDLDMMAARRAMELHHRIAAGAFTDQEYREYRRLQSTGRGRCDTWL